MSAEQTSLFKDFHKRDTNAEELTNGQKAYLWLEQHKYAGYDSKYHILSYQQLVKFLHWNILQSSQISDTKQKMLKMLSKLKSTRYYHIHSFLKYTSYDDWIIEKIKNSLKQQLQNKNNR